MYIEWTLTHIIKNIHLFFPQKNITQLLTKPHSSHSESVQWHHMNVMTSPTTGNLTVCPTVCSGQWEITSKIHITGPLWVESTMTVLVAVDCFYNMQVKWKTCENVSISWFHHVTSRDSFVCAPSQWEMALQCNVASHWLGAYRKCSLN